MHITSSKDIPNKPGCFDENTKLTTKKGIVTIKNLKVGDELLDGSKITAFLHFS